MFGRLTLWLEIHDGYRHLDNAWTIGFGGLMLAWPFILLASGYNVFDKAWYWITYLL